MGTLHFGPKHLIDTIKAQVNENKQTILEELRIADKSLLTLQNHISEMELDYKIKLEKKETELQAIKNLPPKVVEVPVERIIEKPIEKIVEVIKEVEVPVEVLVDRVVEVEVPIENIREVKVVEEKIIEKLVDRVVEVIVEKPIEVIKYHTPIWLIILPILQAAFEAYLLLK